MRSVPPANQAGLRCDKREVTGVSDPPRFRESQGRLVDALVASGVHSLCLVEGFELWPVGSWQRYRDESRRVIGALWEGCGIALFGVMHWSERSRLGSF